MPCARPFPGARLTYAVPAGRRSQGEPAEALVAPGSLTRPGVLDPFVAPATTLPGDPGGSPPG